MGRSRVFLSAVAAVLLVGCSGERAAGPAERPPQATASASIGSSASATDGTQPSRPRTPRVRPADVRVGTAMEAVRHLAGEVGPRPGTSTAYFRAAAWVQRRLEALGWAGRRAGVPAPAGGARGGAGARGP